MKSVNLCSFTMFKLYFLQLGSNLVILVVCGSQNWWLNDFLSFSSFVFVCSKKYLFALPSMLVSTVTILSPPLVYIWVQITDLYNDYPYKCGYSPREEPFKAVIYKLGSFMAILLSSLAICSVELNLTVCQLRTNLWRQAKICACSSWYRRLGRRGF